MSQNQLDTAMVDTYTVGIQLLAQQMKSRLEQHVRVEYEPGERVSFDQIGVVSAKKRQVQNADTRYVKVPHKRRFVSMESFSIAELLDWQDLLKVLNKPGDAYAKAFMAGMKRGVDVALPAAALGTAYTGKTGTTAVVLPAGQKIAAGGTGFTLAKVRSAMDLFAGAESFDPNDPQDELVVVWNRKAESNFLDTTEVKSVDYNSQRVLLKGTMGDNEFYGFKFKRLEDWTDEDGIVTRPLPLASGTRSCFAYVKSCLLLNTQKEPQLQIDRMPGKDQAWQYWLGQQYGATRMQETGVVQIDVTES